MQTNLSEAMEFIGSSIASKWLFMILASALVLSYFIYKLDNQQKDPIGVILLSIFIFTSFLISLADKNNLRIVLMLTKTISHYEEELEKFMEIQNRRNAGIIEYNANKAATGEIYIVVIGESLNKNHMSLYGYMRDTTPMLQKKNTNNDLLTFRNVYSNHTHSMPTLSQLLTEANQQNQKSYYNSLSIIDILNKANVETYWVTNQILQGIDDNLVGVIASQAHKIYRVNHEFGATTNTRNFDGDMIEIVSDILSNGSSNNKVLFVHLMGSHGDYCKRFPENFNTFSGKLPKQQYGLLANDENLDRYVNCYDNSVKYNDYVMSSLIDKLAFHNDTAGLIYISDHADDVFKKRGHNSGMFTFEMTEIPMLMWFSESYKKKYKSKFSELQNHQNTLFSNDLMYDTLVGVMGITTSHFEEKSDLSSAKFTFPIEKAYTLHGKTAYASSMNYKYWISYNTKKLIKNNLLEKIIPHRVNSIGKLNQVLDNNYASLELDANFFNDGNDNRFMVGHDTNTLSSIKLKDYLALMPIKSMKKIWLDIKNINKNNIDAVGKRLIFLDDLYGLKEKVIIESETTSNLFSRISDIGFHTSCYLPGTLARLYRKNKLDELKAETTRLREQIRQQRCSAVSFDNSLYPYVKKYLEKELKNEVVYHTWDLKMDLKDREFFMKIQRQDYFHDDRIKTILVPYYSVFNL
ncbi:MAG: phosphoethanolamine transferase [Thiohalomonadales bacterium]